MNSFLGAVIEMYILTAVRQAGLTYHAVLDHHLGLCYLIITWDYAIVTTPTQPQLNSKVGFDMKMTLDHHHPPPPTHTNSISVISQLLLTQF